MQLSASLQLAPARAAYASQTRTQLHGLLSKTAAKRLVSALPAVRNWMLVTHLAGRHVTLDAAEMERLDPARRQEFQTQVIAAAQTGFQYLYEAFPLYGKWHAGSLRREAPVLADMFEFLNGEVFLGAMRELVDAPEIGFADAQLTRYRPGHFLTEHDDSVDKGNRIAAYVLGLSPGWRADWGGQLQFVGKDGDAEASFVPRFNTLSVFRVPQPHLVTQIASYAGSDRIAITGWLRAGRDPGPEKVG